MAWPARHPLRVHSRRHVLQLYAAIGLVGCGAGRYPSALSQRPLSMPGGEHQLIVSGGLARDGEQKVFAYPDLSYRVGFTDEVGFALPLVISCGGPVADNLELKGSAGLLGLGVGGTQISKHYRDDPRYVLNGTENVYSYRARVHALGRASSRRRHVWRLDGRCLRSRGYERTRGRRLRDDIRASRARRPRSTRGPRLPSQGPA